MSKEPLASLLKFKGLMLCVGCVAVGLFALGWFAGRPASQPVSFSPLGHRKVYGVQEAAVVLTNHTMSVFRCVGKLTARRGSAEITRSFDVTVAGKGVYVIGVSSPPGTGPEEVSCALTAALCQHPVWVRRLGGLLDRSGIHVYHTSDSSKAPLRVVFGKKPTGVSLSGYLNFSSGTNSWPVL